VKVLAKSAFGLQGLADLDLRNFKTIMKARSPFCDHQL